MSLSPLAPASTNASDCSRLARQVRAALPDHGRVCFVSGNFNVLHPGHLRLLKFAAELAECVVVGVLPDSTPGVSVASEMRVESLQALSLVAQAIALPCSPAEFIADLKPEFVIKGAEYAAAPNPEAAAVETYGGRLVFGSGEMQFSSNELLDSEFRGGARSCVKKPLEFPRRHKFEIASLKQCLDSFNGLRVLVVGDLIVDEYVTCDPVGMSQEDPTIVVTPLETRRFVGGAGVVAAHAQSLGANVRFFTVTGDDEPAAFASSWLTERGISVQALSDDTRPTSVKQRFRASGKTLLRVNSLRQHAIGLSLVKRLVRQIDELLGDTDLLLFSDFNYGCLPQGLVEAITSRAASSGVMMGADSQASSQMADISRFKGMNIITPTEREARLAVRDNQLGLAALADRLKAAAEATNVIITLGSGGLLVRTREGDLDIADQLPAFNSAPKDVAGAGDSFFTTTSLSLCAGHDIWRSVYLGSIAAACQVGRIGNAPLTRAELVAEIDMPS
jgi:rfaE bifunctional protein kinase chain/domain